MADLTITAADVALAQQSQRIEIVEIGEAAGVTQGQCLFQALDGAYELAFADSAGPQADADAVGICLTGAADGGFAIIAKDGSKINIGATTIEGQDYVVSPNNAGGIAPSSDLGTGDHYKRLGYATDTSGTLVVDLSDIFTIS